MKQLLIFMSILVLYFFSLSNMLFAEPVTIKIAVIMPEGTKWTNTLYDMAHEIEKKSDNELKFKIYPGAISGDEEDVIRKMRAGLLQAAGFTGAGLGILQPKIRILESPGLYESLEVFDYVKNRLFDDFSAGYEKKGYILLGFFDAGFVYFFSKKRIADPKALQATKMWVWNLDKVGKIYLKKMGVNSFPLPVTDVITGLETDMIDSYYSPLLAAVAMQWHSRVRYVLDSPLVVSIGAVLMKKNIFDRLTKKNQRICREVTQKYCNILVKLTREDNLEAQKILENLGFEFIPPSEEQVTLIQESAAQANEKMIGDLYTKIFYEKVQRLIKEYEALDDHHQKN